MPLPAWAGEAEADGGLLVPEASLAPGEGEPWRRVDWLEAARWYLAGEAERAKERESGPIHSYSLRLGGWDARAWERAWVNRIALWLRLWAARAREVDADRLLGPLPRAEVLITHDVDAIRKTRATRIKQSAFHGLNAARLGLRGRIGPAAGRVGAAARFAFGRADYWRFPEMTAAEERRGWRSVFHVHAGPAVAGRSLRLRLMDPSYDPAAAPLRTELERLVGEGWGVGLHPSFDSWGDAARIAREREAVAAACGRPVTLSRQHWLRFSWERTWAAQAEAGIRLDSTLGFNDRPGFRNGAALAFRPLGEASRLVALPLVLMDAHLYDYRPMTFDERATAMDRILGEVRAVRGQASLLWHQRVLSPDYGWEYEPLLDAVARNGLAVVAPSAESFDGGPGASPA